MTTQNDVSSGTEALMRKLRGGRGLSHAYIISGPAGSGRHALADWMAACYVCSGKEKAPCGGCSGCRKAAAGIHPDIIRVGMQGEAINVASVRALRADAYIRPNEAVRKVYLLDHAQNMNANAQNALLKVLEDGPPYAAFLLLTENDTALLPTVRSRCEVLHLTDGADTEESGDLRESAERFTELLYGGDETALLTFAVRLEKYDKADLTALLDEAVTCLRNRLLKGGEDTRRLLYLADHVKTARRACDYNIGAGHLAGWLAAGAFQTVGGSAENPRNAQNR